MRLPALMMFFLIPWSDILQSIARKSNQPKPAIFKDVPVLWKLSEESREKRLLVFQGRGFFFFKTAVGACDITIQYKCSTSQKVIPKKNQMIIRTTNNQTNKWYWLRSILIINVNKQLVRIITGHKNELKYVWEESFYIDWNEKWEASSTLLWQQGNHVC